MGRRWGGCLWLHRSGFWVSEWRRGFAAWVFFGFDGILWVVGGGGSGGGGGVRGV